MKHLTKKQQINLIRILAAGLLLLMLAILRATVLPDLWYLQLPLFLIPYGIAGWDVLEKAARNIYRGQVFDETFLMALATIGAFGIGEYPEAVFVMLFYQLGELFQSIAVGKSRRSIAALMDIRPDEARCLRNGEWVAVSPDEVEIGERILVRPGEKVPLDGVVESGESELNLSSLTGESLPKPIRVGEPVYSGSVNLGGVLEITVTKRYEDSTVAKILELVENSALSKSKAQNAVEKFAKWYTPSVVIGALLLFLIPSIITKDPSTWLYSALVFLVVSCPCALVISVPLSYFGGLGCASKRGILIKGANYLEALSSVETAVFDKTGTLTEGKFRVSAIHPVEGVSPQALLQLAATLEKDSNHPVAKSILEEAGSFSMPRVQKLREEPGRGISGEIAGKCVLAGNRRLMEDHAVSVVSPTEPGSVIYLAENNSFLGSIVISDTVKESAVFALSDLKQLGVRKTVMLTGDSAAVAERVAKVVGVDEVRAELLPMDKVKQVEGLLAVKNGALLFAGDGVNDAPVLALADVGVAMGAVGSDAAIEAADVVLMDDDPEKIPSAIRISRFTRTIVRENIAFALGIKFLFLALSALHLTNLWMAAFADVGVAVIAILNAMRTLAYKEQK